MASPRQKKQQTLYISLGTVVGFKGWLLNFQHAAHQIADPTSKFLVDYHIEELNKIIKDLDAVARIKMQNIK